MPLTPRWYQQEAIDKTIEYLHNSTGNGVVQVPTAGGKSLIQAECSRKIRDIAPHFKIMCVTHITALIEQNYNELKEQWPEASAGIYSASYKRKQTNKDIIFCGVQSVYKKPEIFGPVSVLFVDECQSVPLKNKGMYIELIEGLKKQNPYLRVIGLSATPWQLKGSQTDGNIFDDVYYKIYIRTLLDEGFLCPLVTPKTSLSLDRSTVPTTSGGDFNQTALQEIMDDNYLTEKAIDDALYHGKDRNSWLVFTSGVEHCKNVCEALNKRGVSAEYIYGDTSQEDRDSIVERFRTFQLKAIVSVNTILVGFNAKNADLLVSLRATKSSGLWLQMLGRGMRTHPSKKDCMVLDYGGNIEFHGPTEDIDAPRRMGDGGKGEAPIKQCWNCENPVPASLSQCPHCGSLFDMQTAPNHGTEASTADILKEIKEPEWFNVNEIIVRKHHQKSTGNKSLCCTYLCGINQFKEWVMTARDLHNGKFAQWWIDRGGVVPVPATVDDAIKRKNELNRPPAKIKVDSNDKYDKILEYGF